MIFKNNIYLKDNFIMGKVLNIGVFKPLQILLLGAEEETRTPKVFQPLAPETSASTNFATSAYKFIKRATKTSQD